MDPLGHLVDWIAIYGIFGLFAIGLAERFLPALTSYGVLVAIGIAADDELWSLHTAVLGTTVGSCIGALVLYLLVGAVGKRRATALLYSAGYLDRVLRRMTQGRDFLEQGVIEAYHEAFNRPSVRRAIIDDYRSALREDLQHDLADRKDGHKLRCPVFVSWAGEGRQLTSPIDIWRRWADDVTGGAIPGGHLQPEDAPEQVTTMLLPFLSKSVIT